MNKEKAEQDLAFIRKVFDDSRTLLVDNGLHYLIWGTLSIIGTLLTYGALYLKLYDAIPWIWAGFFIMGTLSAILIERMPRTRSEKTFAGRVYGFVWLGTLLFTFITAGCLYLSNKFSLELILAIVAGGLGAAYFIASTITRIPWMFALSFVWWTGSVILIFMDGYYAPLVLVAFVFVCELIPGFILFVKWRKTCRDAREGSDAAATE